MSIKTNGISRGFQKRQASERNANSDGKLATLRPPRLSRSYGWEAFGQLVVQWRVERGLSSHELADDAGVSIEVINTIEEGTGMPSARYILTLGELMELSVEKLLRLVGIVRTTQDEDLLQAALQFLASTTCISPDSTPARIATERFRQVLRREG